MEKINKLLYAVMHLKEISSQVFFLFPKLLFFSCIVYLPVFVSKVTAFMGTGEFSLHGDYAAFFGAYLMFLTVYFCGEFLVERKILIKDIFATHLFGKCLKSFCGLALSWILFCFPLGLVSFMLLPATMTNPPERAFVGLYAIIDSIFIGVAFLLLAAFIWKGLGIFASIKYLFKTSRGLRIEIIGASLFVAFFIVGQTILNFKYNPIILDMGLISIFLKFVFDFIIFVLLNIFNSLLFIKIFINMEEIHGCVHPLTSVQEISLARALEDVEIYKSESA